VNERGEKEGEEEEEEEEGRSSAPKYELIRKAKLLL
jgi:hypothetical protein